MTPEKKSNLILALVMFSGSLILSFTFAQLVTAR